MLGVWVAFAGIVQLYEQYSLSKMYVDLTNALYLKLWGEMSDIILR